MKYLRMVRWDVLSLEKMVLEKNGRDSLKISVRGQKILVPP